MTSQLSQVRGAALWARREWIRHTKGEQAVADLLEVLSPAGRHLLRSDIDRHGWYNYPLFIELAVKMDRQFGDGGGRLNIELGRWSAHLNTRGIFKMFIRLGSVSWAIERASRLWSEHFNRGSMAVEAHAADRWLEAEIVDFPHPHLCFTYAVLGFAIGVVEMSGEPFVRGDVVSCQSHGAERTLLRVQWGAPPSALIDDIGPDPDASGAR